MQLFLNDFDYARDQGSPFYTELNGRLENFMPHTNYFQIPTVDFNHGEMIRKIDSEQ
ncbi:MAG: hypothetical protein LKF37_02610 [Lentilactobacillus diolivorans]|jgi:hypothetical protein|nr:hypothetical protein [Lentilactobacillus diolivorans]